MNRVQFQPGLSLPAFLVQYGSEGQCERALEAARWPDGFVCPRCAGKGCSKFYRHRQAYWQCSQCRHQSSLRSGTVFEHSRLPLRSWLLAMYPQQSGQMCYVIAQPHRSQHGSESEPPPTTRPESSTNPGSAMLPSTTVPRPPSFEVGCT
jgi:ribosomal protein L37AE/L43A